MHILYVICGMFNEVLDFVTCFESLMSGIFSGLTSS